METIIEQIDNEVTRCEEQIEKFPASQDKLMSRIQGILFVRQLIIESQRHVTKQFSGWERDIIVGLEEKFCCCHPAYKDRGLIDPQCQMHDIKDFIQDMAKRHLTNQSSGQEEVGLPCISAKQCANCKHLACWFNTSCC